MTTSSSAPIASQTASRRDFRSLVFHLLYAMDSYDYTMPIEQIVQTYANEFELDIPLDGEIVKMVSSIVQERYDLDQKIKPLLDNWSIERLGMCTLLILRLAIWELIHTDTPSIIVINEGIELAKGFSERDAYKFVNGILDQAAKKFRNDKPVA